MAVAMGIAVVGTIFLLLSTYVQLANVTTQLLRFCHAVTSIIFLSLINRCFLL